MHFLIKFTGSTIFILACALSSAHLNLSKEKKKPASWNPPSFNNSIPNNLTVFEGNDVTLVCAVSRLRGRSVSWIRKKDLTVISANELIFTSDDRFKVITDNNTSAWMLQITPVLRNDSGVYECQVNTRPKLSWPVTLNVLVPSANITGPAERHIKSGSTIILTCTATLHPDAKGTVQWFHNGSSINITGPRGGISIHTEKIAHTVLSRLSVIKATLSDAGNYTCIPSLISPAFVMLFVVEDDIPAAMHHESGVSRILDKTSKYLFIFSFIVYVDFAHMR